MMKTRDGKGKENNKLKQAKNRESAKGKAMLKLGEARGGRIER